MDIKAKVEEIVKKVTSDKNIAAKFQKDPTGTVKSLIGVDIPDEQLKTVVEAVKGKVSLDKLGGAAEKLGGLFGKK